MEDFKRYYNRIRELYPERFFGIPNPYAEDEPPNADPTPERLYTAKEVAGILGKTSATVVKHIKDGTLEGEYNGRRYYIPESSVEAFKTRKKKKKYRRKTSKEIRQLVLSRDNGKCVLCGCGGELDVHHIKYRSEGGTEDLNNLVSLCKRCHAMQHEGEPIHNLMIKCIKE